MLLILSILLFFGLLNSGEAVQKNASKLYPDYKITVALSERNPFVILNQNGAPKGLDILIIENFARKSNLQIDYFLVNMSLNYIFVDEDSFNAFPDQTSLR